MIKDIDVFRKNKNFVSRTIDDEVILMPLLNDSGDIDCIYTLNSTAGKLWELVDGNKSLAKIKEIALGRFEVTPSVLSKEVAALFKDLVEIKAVLCKK